MGGGQRLSTTANRDSGARKRTKEKYGGMQWQTIPEKVRRKHSREKKCMSLDDSKHTMAEANILLTCCEKRGIRERRHDRHGGWQQEEGTSEDEMDG